MKRHHGGAHHKAAKKHHHRKGHPQKHKKQPPLAKWRKFLEEAIYPIGILGPLFTIPQLMQVWSSKSAVGLSLTTWLLWVFVAFFWLAYGIERKDKPIIFCYSAWILVEIGVVVGIVLYGDMIPAVDVVALEH